jgi:prophage regulatory protein
MRKATSTNRRSAAVTEGPDAGRCWPRDQDTLRQISRLRLISMAETAQRVLLSRVHVYRLINLGRFPRPIKIGAARIGFVESEVDDFIRARIAQRDGAEVGANA